MAELPTETAVIEQTEVKQKCMMCNSLLAKTFIELGGEHIHLCQNDANALLRIACHLKPAELRETVSFFRKNIYGMEE